jgi:BirA family biotin operon repressor/biotin-[acetyl-CoA-carboxylase] ligase
LQYPILEIFERVDSTMDVARERIQQGDVRLDDGMPTPFAGLLAREQTAGRGQRGRVWNSRPGASLCATFYFRHGLDLPAELGMVALLAGVAVAATLTAEAVASNSSANIGLKWPNDILINGGKAGGILIETARTPEGRTVVLIGVGLNLGTGAFPPKLASTATTLETAGIVVTDPIVLAENLAMALREQADLFRQEGQAGLLARWRALDRTAGRRFHTEHNRVPITGIAEGIDEGGRLLLRLPDQPLVAVGAASTLQETLS